MELDEFQALWLTEQLTRTQVEDMAVTWLEAGYDGPCLRELAWHHDSWREINELITGAIGEIGHKVMSEREARTWFVRKIASGIVDGTVDPYEGALEIYWECWAGEERPEEIQRFYWIFYDVDYDENYNDKPSQELKDKLKEEARFFLSQVQESI